MKVLPLLIFVLSLVSCSKTSVNAKLFDYNSLSFVQEPNLYAKEFSISKSGSYSLVTISDGQRFLVVPEGKVENVPLGITVLHQPFNKTYVVSSSVMDLINKIGALDKVRFTGTRENEWYIPSCASLMKEGKLKYAGKYSAPDYEMLLKEGTDFVIENTMIYHKTQVLDKLKELGLPCLVERSTYESHPMGRIEWIRLYGLLYNKEEEALRVFNKIKDSLKDIKPVQPKTVSFFYITTNGSVVVRRSSDYIPFLLEMGGASYIYKNLAGPDRFSTVNMQMEKFYATSKDADILIYNSTIDKKLESLKELTERCELFKDFKAYKTGEVYTTDKNFFQETSSIMNLALDMNKVLRNEETFTFLKKVE